MPSINQLNGIKSRPGGKRINKAGKAACDHSAGGYQRQQVASIG